MVNTFKNDKGQIVGRFKEGIYRKIVNSKKHKMKVYDGYGIDQNIIEEIANECTMIRLLEEDTKKIFSVPFSVFNEKGIRKTFSGQTPQVFLPLKYWTHENVLAKETKQIRECQHSLWRTVLPINQRSGLCPRT